MIARILWLLCVICWTAILVFDITEHKHLASIMIDVILIVIYSILTIISKDE